MRSRTKFMPSIAVIGILGVAIITLLAMSNTRAFAQGCSVDISTADSIVKRWNPVGEYSVYVHSTVSDAGIKIAGINATTCDSLTGKYQAGWSNIGTLNPSALPSTMRIIADKRLTTGSPAVDRIVFVAAGIACEPLDEIWCTGADGQQTIRYRPVQLNEDGDLLKVGYVAADGATTRVDYYIGSAFAYSKPTLETIDTRYVDKGDNAITATIHFADGRIKELSYPIHKDSSLTPYQYAVFWCLWHKRMLTVVGYVMASLVGAIVVLVVAQAIVKKQHWKRTHTV